MSKRKPPEWQIAAERDIKVQDLHRQMTETLEMFASEKAEARRVIIQVLEGSGRPLTLHEIETISCLSEPALFRIGQVLSELVKEELVQKVDHLRYQMSLLDRLAKL